MKKVLTMLAASVALAVFASAALAAVTFDPATGKGFVGKGDLQQPWGWNNAQMNAKAGDVTFTYETTDRYTATCTWVTGEGTKGEKTHNVDLPRTTKVQSTVSYEQRKNGGNGNLTGFALDGFGDNVASGVAPQVGDACPGNPGHDGTYSAVTGPVSLGAGELYAHHPDKDSLLIWTPPVAE